MRQKKRKRKNKGKSDEEGLSITIKQSALVDMKDGELPGNGSIVEDIREKMPRDENDAIDCRELNLKPDHAKRPIWVTHGGRIYLETFSPIFKQAYDFLISIADPMNRPERIHEYQLTPSSLYAAALTGRTPELMIERLTLMCKTDLPKEVVHMIKETTAGWGQVSITARKNRYFIESSNPDVLEELVKDEVVQEARITNEDGAKMNSQGPRGTVKIEGLEATKAAREKKVAQAVASKRDLTDAELVAAANELEEQANQVTDDLAEMARLIDADDSDQEEEVSETVDFEVSSKKLEAVQNRCFKLGYPLLAEYDFQNDTEVQDIDMALKPTTVLRPYQEKCLRRMFSKGRARSGLIVLPCGAGKTLTGVAAACTIKKRVLVLCTSQLAVEQWKSEFARWANLDYGKITRFTADHKDHPSSNGILISTYSILAGAGERSAVRTKQMINFIRSRTWGLMILDEVQVAPARTFRTVMSLCPCHCKIGLTATLVREDGKIQDLLFLIGPKLYEANWMDLQNEGYIAKVRCSEVWVSMTPQFYKWYLSDHADSGLSKAHVNQLRKRLYCMNPNKYMAMEYLIRKHERLGDKIIVFSDDIFALETFAKKMKRYYIRGDVDAKQRQDIIQKFKFDPKVQTIFCSKIADNSFDLPNANVLIQISSHGAGRRQEAQRLGRILRRKPGSILGETHAYFYSIISTDTKDLAYNKGRQRFLVDQGYSYDVIDHLPGMEEEGAVRPFGFSRPDEQEDLLTTILHNKYKDIDMNDDDDGGVDKVKKVTNDDDLDAFGAIEEEPSRKKVSMASLSGADGMVYQQFNKGSF
eukprot:m.30818 g.30818  ORF g.30818 m.30818 type:complete len:815 (+) comp8244_c0_seq1:331-2775(+)